MPSVFGFGILHAHFYPFFRIKLFCAHVEWITEITKELKDLWAQ